jgi:dihydroorotate dehydrogenase electron transfer subunit
MVRCGEDTLLPRPFSIHQLDGNKIALLVNVVGKGTEWLSKRQAGNNVDLFGLLGNGFHLDPAAKNILLVAGGIGIAPLRFLADEALKQKKGVTLLMGAASAVHLLPEPIDTTNPTDAGLLTDGVLPWGITIHRTTDDGSSGYKGLVTHLLIEQQLLDQADQIFACGPLPMYKTMAQMAELKNKPVQVSLEITMGCGRGVCYGCTIKTKQGLKKVCQDGPVFNLDDILWDETNYL